jgi:hypothetical protein
MADEQVTIRARCLCNSHTFTAPVSKQSLPLTASLCHCTSCRHSSGALFVADVPWPNKDEDLSKLKSYSFSSNTTIFSCGTCSTQMFAQASHLDGTIVFTGALENTPGLVRYGNHIFVGDTKDGGASTWLVNGPDGATLSRWVEREGSSQELSASWPERSKHAPINEASGAVASPDLTPLWCHCRGVQFFLKSGKDLASGTDKRLNGQPEKGTGRYTTHIDACDSCRMAHGVADLIHWAFVPLDHLYYSPDDAEQASGPLQTIHDLRDAVARKDPGIGTLAIYRSSERAERYHCSNCSATIFYTEHDLPDQADIAIGVLDHPDGARAEGLLAWDRSLMDHIKDTKGGWREGLASKYLDEAGKWDS